jgi:hypothetical protein
MAYTGNNPKDMTLTEPTVGTAKVSELDDAIRQVKSAVVYSDSAFAVKTANHTLTDTDHVIIVNSSSARTMTLPSISSVASSGVTRKYIIYNLGTANVTVASSGGDSSPSVASLAQYESCLYVAYSANSSWVCLRFSSPTVGTTTPPACEVVAGGSQSVNGSQWTKVQFTSRDIDVYSNFNISSTYRWLPTEAGYYHVHAQVEFNSDFDYAEDDCSIAIYKNGSSIKDYTDVELQTMQISGLVYLNGSTDYIEIYINPAESRTLTNDTRFTSYKVG